MSKKSGRGKPKKKASILCVCAQFWEHPDSENEEFGGNKNDKKFGLQGESGPKDGFSSIEIISQQKL